MSGRGAGCAGIALSKKSDGCTMDNIEVHIDRCESKEAFLTKDEAKRDAASHRKARAGRSSGSISARTVGVFISPSKK
jgi:hypothetical protein